MVRRGDAAAGGPGVGIAAALLLLGFGSAAAGFALAGSSLADTAADPSTPVPLPPWVFWAVWLVIYPTLGVATSLVVVHGRTEAARGALLLFLVNTAITAAFVPVTVLGDDIRITAILDLVGLVAALCLGVAYARVSRPALLWTIPYLVWMPITTALKWTLVVLTVPRTGVS